MAPIGSLVRAALTTALIGAGVACDPRILDAVELITRPEGGGVTEGGPANDDGSTIEGGAATEGGGAREGGVLQDSSFEGGRPPEASTPLDSARETGSGLDASCAPDAPNGPTTWPNCVSSANSDAWLVQHHDALTVIRPRLLILHFYNAWTKAQAEAGAQLEIRVTREGSRYHGYSQANAPPFLEYE
ncbi:MAG TPA: hypothetical protein VK550_00280, partial [Polyangiaceae bacterium]|nr:hypothetical protein [Polyangiaceae bacterium]